MDRARVLLAVLLFSIGVGRTDGEASPATGAASYWRVICKSGTCTDSYQSNNEDCTARNWMVNTLVFSGAADCKEPAKVTQVLSSGTAKSQDDPSRAFDTAKPENDHKCYCGVETSFLSDDKAATPGLAWIGAKLDKATDVKCVKIAQTDGKCAEGDKQSRCQNHCRTCPHMSLEQSTDGTEWKWRGDLKGNQLHTTFLVTESTNKPLNSDVWTRWVDGEEGKKCSASDTCIYYGAKKEKYVGYENTCTLPTDDTVDPAAAAGAWADVSITIDHGKTLESDANLAMSGDRKMPLLFLVLALLMWM